MAAAPEHFDLISLGGGEAGKYIAWNYAVKCGKKCAVVEREWIGGSCPNVACLPSKNLIHSANVAHYTRLAEQYGLGNLIAASDSESIKPEMKYVKTRKVDMVTSLVNMHLGRFKDTKVELIKGEGKIIGAKQIQVDGDRVITAEKLIICTGSRAVIDGKVPGLDNAQPLTHIETLNLEILPKHLIILGGGYVGLEFAQAFRRFGSEVTVIDRNPRVLKNEDGDVVEALVQVLNREGVKFLTSTTVTKVEGISGERVSLNVRTQTSSGFTESVIGGSHLLAAAGRTPNTSNIGLQEHGINLTDQGFISVNEQLQTTAPDVYAVGDCAGSPHFTHIAYDDFRIVFSHLTGSPRTKGTKGRQIPSTLFTSPELAHVGLREHEAKAQSINYRLVKLPTAGFLRSRTIGETDGFAKALIEADGDKILGFTALTPSAGELLPVIQLAMKSNIGYQEIANLIITHPTMCEGLAYLFAAVPAKA